MTKKLERIQATSQDGLFILTYLDADFLVETVELAFEDTTPIIMASFPVPNLKHLGWCDWDISPYFDPVLMQKGAEELLDAIPAYVNTKKLETVVRRKKWRA